MARDSRKKAIHKHLAISYYLYVTGRFQPNTKNPKVGTSGIFSYQLSIAAQEMYYLELLRAARLKGKRPLARCQFLI